MPEPYTVHLFPVITLNMYNIYITLCAILVILLIYYIILHYTQFFCYREQNLNTLINVRGYFIVDKKEKKKPKKVGTGITVTAEHRAYTFLSKSLEILFRALC